MDIQTNIRSLARSEYWQTLYKSSQDLNNISLFENQSNFSSLQVMFLYWLKVYSLLYEELSSNEWSNLYEKTISDDILCDAFLYWRSREIDKKSREHKKQEKSLSRNKGKKFDQENSFKIFRGETEKVK